MAEIKLTNSSSVAIIDDSDKGIVDKFKWRAVKGRNTYYAASTIDGKPVLMHRMILGIKGRYNHVDHKNGNGLDNRRENIRLCSCSQNNINRPKYKNNRAGIKGVNTFKNGKFGARITIGGKLIHLGTFSTSEEAGRAYDKFARIHHGEFANLNFSD